MPRRDRDRLLDILDAVDRIETLAGPELDALDESDARWDAILYNLVVLGEAANPCFRRGPRSSSGDRLAGGGRYAQRHHARLLRRQA